MEEWEKEIIRKYADLMTLDYCVDCGYFVIGKADIHYKHLVVKIHN